ncbi:nucleoporin protein Ndc1-Nup protein [Trifolium repens]|nr:nucleoporin protein Ndc1-Nup protein [Trifolium repens]
MFSVTLSSISSPSSHSIFEPSHTFLFFAVELVYAVAFSGSSFAESLFGLKDFRRIRLRGGLVGLVFGLHYVFKNRWVLEFPIIQVMLLNQLGFLNVFLNFKKGIPLAAKSAFKLSAVAIILEVVLLEIIPCPFLKCSIGTRAFFAEQIVVFVSSYALLFLWEMTHTIHRVFYTKRPVFAPPRGSAAAETNPSEHLLSALEESNPTSILRYLAYLDLCMVCENNVDTWRRAAFFEESGETYIRVIAVCLRPLEQLASRLGEDLGNSADKPTNLLNQLSSPTDVKHAEELYDFQPYAWCSRIVASLTACSRKEDKFGVAKLSGSNAAVISTLISCLLAVENFMGNQLLGLTGIKWTTANGRRLCIETAKSRRLDIATATGKRKNGPANSKAYAIADVLKTSIYQIVSAFHDEMLAGTLLEKDWITSEKPLFGTHEMLIEKLCLFLDCWAT